MLFGVPCGGFSRTLKTHSHTAKYYLWFWI